MLTERDLDFLMLNIQGGKETFIYYIAHRVECREGFIDEYQYKSSPDFRILKLKITDINNALFEYLKFAKNPEKYHTEAEESYADEFTKYVYYYTVPNHINNYEQDFNPRIPSAIFGYKRKLYRSGILVDEYNDPTPIKPIYTNSLRYSNLSVSEVAAKYNNGMLNWKYKKLDVPGITDGISYDYITSDWYILDIENFPRVEKPLVNTKTKTAYFMTNEDAQSYMRELKA